MLRTAPCEWALKEASLFSSVIDFSSEKYIVFIGQQVLLDPGTNKCRYGEVQGALSHLTYRGSIQDSKLYPKCIRQVYARRQKSMKKGYKFLMIHVGTTFCKFMKIVFTNHIFKIFYVYTKVPNSAKKFDHKKLD